MVKNIYYILIGLLVIAISACTDEIESGAEGISQGNALLHLDITIPNTEIIQSRATSGLTDISIENLHVLLFDTEISSTDEKQIKLIAHRQANLTNNTVDLPLSDKSRLVYVVANVDKLLANISTTDDDLMEGTGYKYSLADIRDSLVTPVPVLDNNLFVRNTMDIPQLPIPMSSEGMNYSKLTSNTAINVSLTRMLSKISVDTSLGDNDFKIEEVSIYRGADRGRVLPVSLPVTNDGSGFDRMAYTVEGNTIYSYPTYVDTASDSDIRKSPVSVIIKASYKGETATYYRLRIRTKADKTAGKETSLTRNCHYKINIKSVDAAGASDITSAILNPEVNEKIDYSVDIADGFNSTTIEGGVAYSLDIDRVVVYADSLENAVIATLKTNFKFPENGSIGRITVDKGLNIEGRNYFVKGDSLRSFIINVTPEYSNSLSNDNKSKGIHISLGAFNRTIQVLKEPSIDIHPVSIALSDISTARLTVSGGSSESGWLTFSLYTPYSPHAIRPYLDETSLSFVGNKGYLHLDENIDEKYREAYVETTSKNGVRTKYILHQEGFQRYLLGYLGGGKIETTTIKMYDQQLIIEGYEENPDPLDWMPTNKSLSEEDMAELAKEDAIKATYLLADKYNSPAAIYCLNKNRDKNGNGKIDENEILWYLPSRTQGIGISFYQSLVNNIKAAYWSSTYNKEMGTWSLFTLNNNDEYKNQIGSAGFQLTAVPYADTAATGKARYVRCVRNY